MFVSIIYQAMVYISVQHKFVEYSLLALPIQIYEYFYIVFSKNAATFTKSINTTTKYQIPFPSKLHLKSAISELLVFLIICVLLQQSQPRQCWSTIIRIKTNNILWVYWLITFSDTYNSITFSDTYNSISAEVVWERLTFAYIFSRSNCKNNDVIIIKN